MPLVLIPWRGGCPHREEALSWVLRRYEALGWSVELCEPLYNGSPQGSGDAWCKAEAVMPAVEAAPNDLLVIADADVWTEGLERAAWSVICGEAEWAVPHTGVFRFSERATAEVLAGGELREDAELDQRPYKGTLGGGIVIARRDALLEVPLDHRFKGWGQEDSAWGIALSCLLGRPWREKVPLFHFWHPPQERMTRRYGSMAGKRLLRRYAGARSAAEMTALIEEAKK